MPVSLSARSKSLFILFFLLFLLICVGFFLLKPFAQLNKMRNRTIVSAVTELGDGIFKTRQKYNGIPSNSALKEAVAGVTIVSCDSGDTSRVELDCLVKYKASLPQSCSKNMFAGVADVGQKGSPCYIHVFSTGDFSNGSLGAGRFRIIAKLWGVDQVAVYDYKEGNFVCNTDGLSGTLSGVPGCTNLTK